MLDNEKNKKPCIVICGGTGGQASGSNDLIRIIKRRILEQDLHDKLSLKGHGLSAFVRWTRLLSSKSI